MVDGQMKNDPATVKPHLAESWKISPDGKTWVFKLREGIKSPYGNELTADDVEWVGQNHLLRNGQGTLLLGCLMLLE